VAGRNSLLNSFLLGRALWAGPLNNKSKLIEMDSAAQQTHTTSRRRRRPTAVSGDAPVRFSLRSLRPLLCPADRVLLIGFADPYPRPYGSLRLRPPSPPRPALSLSLSSALLPMRACYQAVIRPPQSPPRLC
jgi:hypothetical protein